MSISSINNSNIPDVNPTNAITNEKLKQQYQEQYQQFLSQYEYAHTAWGDVSPSIKTYVGERVCLAIDNRLTNTKTKLDAFKAAIESSDPKADALKTMADELKALLSKLTADIAAVPTLATNAADIEALRRIWENVPNVDKMFLGSEFIQAIEARFSALNAKISELKQAIEEGKESSIIENLQTEIAELKTQLGALINGTRDGAVMSIMDRIACLKSLEEAREYAGDKAYATLKQQLLQTDVSKQISREDFETQLQKIILPTLEKQIEENAAAAKSASSDQAAKNELLRTNITLQVMQAENIFRELKYDVQAEQELQEKAEFNPQIKRWRDEGQWQTPEMTRQQEMTQMQNEDEQRSKERAQMR